MRPYTVWHCPARAKLVILVNLADSYLSQSSRVHSAQPSVHVFWIGRVEKALWRRLIPPQEQKHWTVQIQLLEPYLFWHHQSAESWGTTIHVRWSASHAETSGFGWYLKGPFHPVFHAPTNCHSNGLQLSSSPIQPWQLAAAVSTKQKSELL